MFFSNFLGDFTSLVIGAAFSFNVARFTITVINVATLMIKRFALRFEDSRVIMSTMVFQKCFCWERICEMLLYLKLQESMLVTVDLYFYMLFSYLFERIFILGRNRAKWYFPLEYIFYFWELCIYQLIACLIMIHFFMWRYITDLVRYRNLMIFIKGFEKSNFDIFILALILLK